MMEFFTPAGGPKLCVDDAGDAGLSVVFQHGLCGDAKQPAEVFPGDGAFRRVTLECRGHGSSDAGDISTFSIARFADDVAELIESKGIAPVVIGGISMGAAIAMRLAVTRPQLIRGLIIARPAWAFDAAPDNMQPNAEVGDLLQHFALEDARTQFENGETFKRLQVEAPDNLASLRGFFSREPIAITSALLTRISADGPDVSPAQLQAIKVPTLVIGHRQDHVHPLAMAQDLASHVPGSRFVEITPKAVDKTRYVSDFKTALYDFLKGF